MPVRLYSKIPVTVEAIQYNGTQDAENILEIIEFTDHKFRVRYGYESSIITAEVYDELHDTWVGVKDGDFIIKGLKGEFYPHDAALFPLAYVESWQQEAFDIFQEVNPTK